MDAGSWRYARYVLGKCLRREIDQLGTLTKADGPQGAPVHRDGTSWVGAADRVCRLLGVEMTVTKGRSPASDWH